MENKRMIVVIDDDENIRTIVRTVLQSAGYNVITCESGSEALQVMQEVIPSLVILDIMMPEMSGYEVRVRMKQQPKTQDIPVMFLSAKGEPEDVLSGYKDYCVEYYITKPFTAQQLLAGVKIILSTPA